MTTADLSQAKGLMVFLANFEPQQQQAYRQWHNAEHIPERVGIPGFLLGRRYLATDDATRFLMCYDTLGEQVQYSDIWANDNYLQFMYERLSLLRDLLAEGGTLWMHCD